MLCNKTLCDSSSILHPLNRILINSLCFPPTAAVSSLCSLAGLQALGSHRDPYQPLPGAALHFMSRKFFLRHLIAHFASSTVEIRTKTSYWVLGAQMLWWKWAVSTSNLHRREPTTCSGVQHHWKNEVAVGEVVSSQDFSSKIKLK